MRTHRHYKERWLHARISEDLEEALKREAHRRRSPVSLVVRNVLEGALDLVEGIVEESLDAADRSRRLARGRRVTPDLEEIYGWQELILNRGVTCARCDAALAIGTNAYRGLRERPGGPAVFLCSRCVHRLHQRGSDNPEKKEGAA
ncbi:MAG TPA: hypothetical protein VL403_01435 [Candidatus Kryptonia bacterium]|nr:hypothetical protein [Candidatus Kryptonia bacterium]